jgi:orotidine-5'-phosphate decarboxylase
MAVHSRHGDGLKLLVPGIRLEGDSPGDQSRVVTPAAAAQAGASYIVVGRSVTASADPRKAIEAVNAQLAVAGYKPGSGAGCAGAFSGLFRGVQVAVFP